MIFGAILILFGLLLLLETLIPSLNINYDLVWPLILILVGIVGTVKHKKLELVNAVMIFIGLWFFLLELRIIIPLILELFWPLVLIIAGMSIIISKISANKEKIITKDKDKDTKTYYGIMGGTTEKIYSKKFEDVSLYAVFGSVDLDLKNADFKNKETVINVYSIFGGSELKMPKDVNVKLNSTALFGGNDNKYPGEYNAKNKTVIINCVSIFGGCDIL